MGNSSGCLKKDKDLSLTAHKVPLSDTALLSFDRPLPSPHPHHNQPLDHRFNAIDHYQPKRFLQAGYTGSVTLVQKKNSPDDTLLALKIIDKQRLKKVFGLEGFEVDQCFRYRNEFLVQIHFVTENERKIFMLMEYVEPEDLSYYIKQEKGLSEEVIRSVVAEILQALKFFAKHKAVYGRLKPQNILVLSSGHIKLSDYEFLAQNEESLLSQYYRGAIQYTAPEIFNSRTYDNKVDVWALGILIYQMRHGCTPFYSSREEESTKRSIRQGLFLVQESCSKEYKDLVRNLITSNPDNRLEIEEIEFHPFFRDIDWDLVRSRENAAPLEEIVNRFNTRSERMRYIRKKRLFLSTSEESGQGEELCIVINEMSVSKSSKKE